MGKEDEGELVDGGAEPSGRKRVRTTIEFPYTDLGRASELTDKLARAGGKVWIEQTQLAVEMDMSPTGGTFRGRLSAARMFGLIETEAGKVRLSDLGLLLLDEPSERRALVDAFLNVELYKTMFDSFNGFALPPAAAIERQMQTFGVPPKQAERARQAFTSSAQYAGYIAVNGRFSKPTLTPAEAKEAAPPTLGGSRGETPPPPPPPPPTSEKKLEYRLVDLMSEAMGDSEVLQAILKVITFLKAQDTDKEKGD